MDAVRKKSFIIARKADGMEMGRLKDGDTMEDDRPASRVKAESDEEKEDVERFAFLSLSLSLCLCSRNGLQFSLSCSLCLWVKS